MAGPWDNQNTVFDTVENELNKMPELRAIQPKFFFSAYMHIVHLLVLAFIVWPWMLTLALPAMIAIGVAGLGLGLLSAYNVVMFACILIYPTTRKQVIGF